jgi:hypothetical protein
MLMGQSTKPPGWTSTLILRIQQRKSGADKKRNQELPILYQKWIALNLTLDMVAGSQEVKCGLKYVMQIRTVIYSIQLKASKDRT